MNDRQRFVKLLRARHPCISIVTSEEGHARNVVVGAALDLARPVLTWSVVTGICAGEFEGEHQPRKETMAPVAALRAFALETQAKVLIMLDLGDHIGGEGVPRALREAVEVCRRTGGALVLVDHQERLPDAIAANVARFAPSLPDEAELAAIAKEALRRLKADERIAIDITHAQFAALVRNLRGLTRVQAEQVIRDVAIADDRIDGSVVQGVMVLKRRVMHTRGLLDAIEVPVSLDEIAGMARLKRWLALRGRALDGATPGLEPPRGLLLLGVPGAGKSLCAKAIATAWQRPLLRLDAGVLYDRWVGESERRLRDALQQAEAMAPVVLWIDEIEKAFASASSSASDGGLSQRMFGSFLTWLQERKAPVFLVATANDIEALPPELLRKGRFDEVFFVDLPTPAARRGILRIHLAKRGRDPAAFDLDALVAASDGHSGAEIEQAIIAALYEAQAAGEALADAHLRTTFQAAIPLAVTMGERIAALRAWAAQRCVSAEEPA